ncbi:MAG: hypothetical protein ACRDTD_00195 [Pseudonocardiaceae bacterium]
MLQTLLEAYGEVLDAAVTKVADNLRIKVSSRVKNTGTLIEKLQRSNAAQLNSIQDLAGMRIVIEGRDRRAQDAVVAQLVNLFANDAHPTRQVDRRADPRSGYRAVHVIVNIDDVPIEIQVRTELQHEWAEFFEKLADRLGRGIRYGEQADVSRLSGLPDNVNIQARQKLVDDIVYVAQLVADLISAIEEESARGAAGQEALERSLGKARELMPLLLKTLDVLTSIRVSDTVAE